MSLRDEWKNARVRGFSDGSPKWKVVPVSASGWTDEQPPGYVRAVFGSNEALRRKVGDPFSEDA